MRACTSGSSRPQRMLRAPTLWSFLAGDMTARCARGAVAGHLRLCECQAMCPLVSSEGVSHLLNEPAWRWDSVVGLLISACCAPVALQVSAVDFNHENRLMASAGGVVNTVWDFSGDGPAGTMPTVCVGHAKLITCQVVWVRAVECSSSYEQYGRRCWSHVHAGPECLTDVQQHGSAGNWEA